MGGNAKEETQEVDVSMTPLERLLSMRPPQELAMQLSESLFSLRARLAEMELEKLNCDYGSQVTTNAAALRVLDKKAKLELEILKTEKVLDRLLLMSRVVEQIVEMHDKIHADSRVAMEEEVVSLRQQVKTNDELIRQFFVNRINMLHRYWLWRTLQELGDLTVGQTFEEELSRGPRYRTIGVQNNILSSTLEQQLAWLQQFAEKEKIFREHVRRLDNLVEELTDVNEALEEALTCCVCGLMFEDPVALWPCGHTFCLVCFDTLSIAPSLFRCPTCGSIGSEGYVHNLLISESVAKWMFKDAGYGDIHGALSLVRLHLSKFRREVIMSRIANLRKRLAEAVFTESKPEEISEMDITYRTF